MSYQNQICNFRNVGVLIIPSRILNYCTLRIIQQEVLTNENDGRHNSSIHGMPLQLASAGYSEMPPASSNESRRRSQHSTRHQSHGIQQELVKTHVPNYDSSSPGQYGFVQENSIANGAASGQKRTKNFSNPMYVEHEANGFLLQGLPAVRPISPEGTFQDTFFDTYAASPGSLYVPEAPQIRTYKSAHAVLQSQREKVRIILTMTYLTGWNADTWNKLCVF